MNIRVAAPLTLDSIVDGPGLRMVLWTQGCMHHCPGCHNPQTHAFDRGMEVEVEAIIGLMKEARLQTGITLSGGEPFLQAAALVPIANAARQLQLDVWAYTGFTWRQLNNRSDAQYDARKRLLQQLDVLVDGRYMQHQAAADLMFRGSSNQRIIDVQRSLETGLVQLYDLQRA